MQATGLSAAQRRAMAAIGFAWLAAGISKYAGGADLLTFGLSTVALAGLAWLVALGTDSLGHRLGPGATGVLQSTLGNLPELFVVIFALRAGETVVAQTSILGSLFANALLVLGLVIVAGARAADDGVMRFRRRLPNDTATLLLLAVFIIVLIGLSVGTRDRAAPDVETISAIGAVLLLLVYGAWLAPYLRSDHPVDVGSHGAGGPALGLAPTLILLAVAGVGAAFVSEWFIAALDPSIRSLHISKSFAGLVIVAIAGNAVENFAGISLAAKGRSDLAISVVKNSVAQIAVFLFPALVLISLLFATTLTFAIAPVYIGALLITAIAVWQITGDGEAFAFEGWALIALYAILAVLTFYE